VSLEDNVKAVVTKVSLGEADAGIVYVTDVTAGGGKVQGVDIPADQNVQATYPIATVKASAHRSQAQAFAVRVALRLSLVCSLGAVAISLLLGVPLAFLLARVPFPGRNLVRALTTLPFTTAGAILAEAFVAMPFLIITTEAGLRAMDRRYEDAAATLGAGRWMRFRRVTLPLVASSLGAGIALCWARALGEFGATITFAGNLPGSTQTMPLAVYIALETDLQGAIALSLILLVVSLAVLIALRDRWFPTA
jgi:molybdate transport system permease protein